MQPDSRIRTDCFTAHFVVTLRFYSTYSAGSFRREAHIYIDSRGLAQLYFSINLKKLPLKD